MNKEETQYRNAQDHFLKTIREGGDGTAHIPSRCTYERECRNYSPQCKPDTCRYISKFYMEIKRP